ncbi:hypothetical protein Hanom_Chr15g01381191 [Helianthus anomalus]
MRDINSTLHYMPKKESGLRVAAPSIVHDQSLRANLSIITQQLGLGFSFQCYVQKANS